MMVLGYIACLDAHLPALRTRFLPDQEQVALALLRSSAMHARCIQHGSLLVLLSCAMLSKIVFVSSDAVGGKEHHVDCGSSTSTAMPVVALLGLPGVWSLRSTRLLQQ
jgi:hypothetical protein